MQRLNIVSSFVFLVFLCCAMAGAEIESPESIKPVECFHYCIPISGRVARVINSVTDEMKISIHEFFALRGMNLHSPSTTKLIKISDEDWKLEFVAVPDVAIVVLLTQSTLETAKNENRRLLAESEMINRIRKGIRELDPTGENLKRLRLYQEEIRKASTRVRPPDE